MADLGARAKLVNARQLTLEVGSDEYVKAQNLFLHIDRTMSRRPTTDGNILYVPGKGNNWFTCELLFTTTEASSLNTLTQTDANGDMTSTEWKFVGTARDGTTLTFATTGFLSTLDVSADSAAAGATKMTIFVVITGDTVVTS